MMLPPDQPVAVSFMGQSIEELKASLAGTRVQGSSVTPDGVYHDHTIREWLEGLKADIEKFLG